MVAAVGMGWFDSFSHAANTCVRVESVVVPNEHNRAIYDALYPKYKAIHDALAPIYRMTWIVDKLPIRKSKSIAIINLFLQFLCTEPIRVQKALLKNLLHDQKSPCSFMHGEKEQGLFLT